MGYECTFCPNRTFYTPHGLEAHKDAKGHWETFECPVCTKSFTSEHGLWQHQDAKEHYDSWDCGVCTRSFGSSQGRDMHVTTVHGNNVCPVGGCLKRFKTGGGLYAHQASKGHFKCDGCRDRFRTQETLKVHEDATGHGSGSKTPACSSSKQEAIFCIVPACNQTFSDDRVMKNHVETHHHWCWTDEIDFPTHYQLLDHCDGDDCAGEVCCVECDTTFDSAYDLRKHTNEACIKKKMLKHHCQPCDKSFQSADALRKHLESLVHKPLSTLLFCIGGCGATFPAPSAMLMHLESGNCAGEKGKQIDKAVIDNAVFQHDTAGVICHGTVGTIPALAALADTFIEFKSSTGSAPSSVYLTPDTSDAGSDTTQVTPSSVASALVKLSFSENPLCCPQCPPFHPPFINEFALEQHLRSLVHAPKIYHCPKAFLPKRVKLAHSGLEFSSLSGFFQHLEAEACPGSGSKSSKKHGKGLLKSAVNMLETMLKTMGLGDTKLLS